MNKLTILFLLLFFIAACGGSSAIKNSEATVEVEEGTEIVMPEKKQETEKKEELSAEDKLKPQSLEEQLIGSWVGYFKKDGKDNDYEGVAYGDEFVWNRENKINISIDKITDSLVFGHSVVAGNDRPFEGTFQKDEDDTYSFKVREPGDDKYDGEFAFWTYENKLTGKWTAYKNIEIKHRKYVLEKKTFTYNPSIMLERAGVYINWNKFIEKKYSDGVGDEGEFEGWVHREFATTTDLIYKVNASNKLLIKPDVENMKKGDLTIIRNTIYARHGYSFKNRPLRVFFDAQGWYIPIHTNIKEDFTEIEKQNIKLLLRYEKNAAVYYDSFGRG